LNIAFLRRLKVMQQVLSEQLKMQIEFNVGTSQAAIYRYSVMVSSAIVLEPSH